MDIGSALVLVGCMVVFFGSIFGTIAYARYLRYRETVVLADKGLLRAERARGDQNALRWGVVTAALGLALCIGLYPFGFLGNMGAQFPLHFGPWMLVGLLPLFFGLGLVLIYVLTNRARKQGDDNA
jgi:4-hydroxybenzoate polyprenyltransferase